jgi:hypothetical protein
MRFNSVCDVKQQLCEGCGEAGGVGALTMKTAAGVSEPRRLAVALGVALGRGAQDFRLAVRITRSTPAAVQFSDKLSARLHGEIDVQHVGVIRAPRSLATAVPLGQERRVRPLVPGYSVAHHESTAGTIGAFVEDASGAIYILSNSHVLAKSGGAKFGDAILQPGPADGGTLPRALVALVRRSVTLQHGAVMDAAVAELCAGINFTPTYANQRINPIVAGVTPRARVWKVGRTTGLTTGVVRAVGVDSVPVTYDGGVVYLDDQIEIDGEAGPFSRGGDSGSLLIDAGNNPVGLLFAGSEQGGATGHGVAYANPLAPVLGAFNMTLIV